MKSIRTFFVCLHFLLIPIFAASMTCNNLNIVSITQTQTSCNNNDGAANIYITGVSNNYSYKWTDLSDNSLVSESVGTDQVRDGVTNLEAGYYQIIVEDLENNCSETSYFSIKNQEAPTLDIVQTAAPNSCELNNGFLLFNTSANEAEISVINLQNNKVLTGEFENNTIAGLSSGHYVLQISNNSDCSNYYFFEIPVGEANFEITSNTSDPTCNTSNGSITLDVSNNSGNTITYDWFDNNGVAMSPSNPVEITGLSAGIYTLIASSETGCTFPFTFNLENATSMRIDVTSTLDVRCAGDNSGSFDFRMIDGSSPYVYSIPELGIIHEDIIATTTTISSLSGGFYTLEVTDDTGCIVISNIEITEPEGFSVNTIGVDAQYCSSSDGEICFLITGGTPPYRISNSNNGDDYGVFEASKQMQCISGLIADTYSLNIVDDGGCTIGIPNIVLEEPDNCTCCTTFRLLNTDETAANCGSTNGVSSITLDGGSGNYTVTWYNALTNTIVDDQSSSQALVETTGMSPGVYYAIAEDSDCNCNPERYDFSINESNAPTVNIIFENMTLLCPDENRASFEFEVTDGTEPYTYQILGTSISGNVTDVRSTVIDNLVIGNYVVEITDFLGCKGYSMVVSTIAPEPIESNAMVIDIAQCNDDRVGNISLNLTGGTPPYRVTDASNDYGFFNAGQNYIGGFSTGTYNFDISDDNGCMASTGNVEIASLFACADCNCDAFDLQNISSTPESCAGNDGSIDLNLSNGVGPFTYTLRQGDNTIVQYQTTVDVFTFEALPAGNYSIDVVDANCNCEILNQTSDITSGGVEVVSSQTDISCNTTEGQVCMTISGGNAPYTINDGTSDVGSFAEATEECISNLAAGDYTFTITDASDCSTAKSFTIAASEGSIEVDRNLVPATQGNNDGEVCLTISGGTAPYSVREDDAVFPIEFLEATETCIDGLSARDYTLTIIDADGCSTTLSFTIEEAFIPNNISVEVNSTTDASCTNGDGAFCVSISSGVAPYTLTDGDFSITDIPEGTETCTDNLTTGTYNFTVSDSNGNNASQTLTITISQENSSITVSPTTTGESCTGNDGEICLTISGGTAPYSVSDGTTDFGTFEENTEKCVSNLPSKIYSLNITDANSCVITESIVLGLQSNDIAVAPELSDASCGNSDGEICLTISGGTAPYSVSDANNDYGSFEEATQGCIPSLGEGTYDLNITDASGCAATENLVINAPEDTNNISITANPTSGCSDNSGQICLTIAGGTAPYSVSDDSVNYGDLSEDTEQCFSSLATGTYNFSIVDANGCTASETATISQDAASNITITASSQISCSGPQSCVNIVGGNAPYQLQIGSKSYGPFGEDSEDCLGTMANGFYNFIVTDNTGCSTTKTVLINNPTGEEVSSINISVDTQEATCNNSDGQVCLTISGGVAPYSVREGDAVYPVDFSEAIESCIDDFSAGTLTLTITDSEGCSKDEVVTIGASSGNISATVDTTPASCDDNDGEICLTISGGTAPYTVTDNNNNTYTDFENATEKCMANFASGGYVLNIVDADGCTFTSNASVSIATDCGGTPPIAANDSFNINGNGESCFNVFSNDTETDSDALSLQSFTQPNQGLLLEGTANGELCYTPPTDFDGEVSFTYTVCDDDGCVDASVTLSVSQKGCENATFLCTAPLTPLDICVEFCDLDGVTSIDAVHTLFECGITTDGLCLEYIPLPGFIDMTQVLEIIGCNNSGVCDTIFIDVYVGDCSTLNGPPEAVNDIAESDGSPTSINVLQNDSDPDGDVFNITEFTQPPNGTVTQVGNELVYTPNPGFEGNDTFTYTICDESGECDTAIVTVSVELPCDNPSNLCTGLMEPIEICVEFCELEGVDEIELVHTLFDCGITTDGLCVTYTPLPGFIDLTENLQIIGCDDLGVCDTVFVDIYVGDCTENQAPVAVDDNVDSDGSPTTINVLLNDFDPEGNSFNITEFTQPANGTVTQVGNDLVYTPNDGFEGNDTFTYTICDENGECDTATVSVNVDTCTNPTNLCTAPITPLDICVEFCNVEGITEIEEVHTLFECGIVTDGLCLNYTPLPGFVDMTQELEIIGCNDAGVCDTVLVSIFVGDCNSANLPPVANDDFAVTPENTPIAIGVFTNDSDPNGDPFSITDFTQPTNGTVTIDGDALVYTPNAGFAGDDTFTYTICDDEGECDTATVTVQVNDIDNNLAPIAVDDSSETSENVPVTINVVANDSDPNNDPFNIVGFTQPANGTVELVGGLLVYTPNDGFSGEDTFSYQICDGAGLCDEATVTVTVTDDCSEFGQFACAEPLQVIEICPVFCDLPDEDLHIISAHSTFACGTNIPENSLCFEYTPLPGFNLTDSIEVIACTADSLLCDTVIFYVFSGCSDPIAIDDTATTPNDQIANIDVLANDWGVACIEELDLTIVDNPNNGIAMVNQDNEIVYTPDPNFEGVDELQYTLCDLCDEDKCDIATVTITVTQGDGNNPIVIAEPDVVQTPFNISIDIDVLANDTGDGLVISNITPAENGTATIHPDGTSIIYEPNEGFSGTDYFFYTICDQTGLVCDTTIVSVTVLPDGNPNKPPTANNDTATTPINTPVSIPVLANDSDLENAPLTIISITQEPTNGTVVIVGDEIVYTPNPGFEGTDEFIYIICDPGGLCDDATVVVAVGMDEFPNNPPIAVEDEVTTPPNTPITIGVLANDSDPDGDNLTVILGSEPMNGIATVALDGSIVYTPNTDFIGVDYLTYILCDDGQPALCDTAYVTINVTNDGGPDPVVIAAPDVVQTPFNISINIDVLANDTGDNISITAVTPAENGTAAITPDGSSIVYEPNPGFSGTDYFFYTICDPTGVFCDSTLVSVTVLPPDNENLSPNANNDVATTPENTPITIPVLANDSDPEGGPLTITSIPNEPTNGTVEIVNGEIVYTPNPDFVGVDSFTYLVCDVQGLCDEATVAVAVGMDEFPNNPPIAVEDVANTNPNTPVTIPVLGNDSDPDGDDLTVTLGSDPMNGTAVVDENGNIIYIPEDGFEGTDYLTYILCDDGQPVLCDTAYVTITVGTNGENQPPIAVDDTGNTLINTPVDISILINDSDPDGDVITLGPLLDQPENGSFLVGIDGTTLTYVPNDGFIGIDCFEYQICDPDGLCDTATVCITVQPPADAQPDVEFTPVNTPIDIDVLVNDIGVELTVTSFSQPENGTVTLNDDNTFNYIPNPDFTGVDYFTYQICDSFGNCDETVVSVTVFDVTITGNNSPTANNDTATTPINTPVEIPVLENDSDPDGDPLIITDLLDIPEGVVLEITEDNTTITVTPEDGFEGCVTFSYIVCDPNGLCDTAEVAVAVGDVDCLNQMPIAVDDGYTTPQGEAIGFDVLENDSDPDGDILTATPITDPANGMLLQEEDGTFTYVPNADFVGTDYFMYIACDDAAMPPLCDTAAVVITILPQEGDPVVANPDISQTGMDTPIEIPVLDNDEGDDLTVNEIVIDPENGTVITDGTTVTYTPDEGFVGTDYFIYETCNTTGQCDTTLVTVIVLPDSITNVPPVAVNDVATTPENTPVEIPVLVNDFDPYGGDTIVITAFNPPLNGTALFDDEGVFTYTPNPDFIGIDSFTYTICDNGTPILCDTATVVINVGSDELPNNPPVAVDDEVTTPPNTPINIPILGNDSDPDGDNIVVTFISVPGHGTAELVDGEIVFTPDSTYVGDDFFSYVICDDGTPVLCDTAYVTVHIMDEVEDNIIDITVTENSDNTICLDSLIASNILTLDFDPESISITTLPSNGTASPSDADNVCFSYAPETDFTGPDQLILEVCNGEGCEIVTVNINVIPLDGIVVIAEDDEITTDINTPIDIPVLGNDAYPTDDSGVVILTILEEPSNGTVLVNGDILGDTTITYTPDTDFAGIDSFQYVLCYTFPDTAICDTALVIVTIDSENNPCELEFANAFSPNGDNINDLFLIQNADNLEECFDAIGELVIFNRWGDEVYRIDGYDNSVAWDGTWQNNGKDVPDGTYFYILQYSANDQPIRHNGFVEVCR